MSYNLALGTLAVAPSPSLVSAANKFPIANILRGSNSRFVALYKSTPTEDTLCGYHWLRNLPTP